MFDAGILGLLERLGQPHGKCEIELSVLSAVPFAGRGSGILARFVMPCWRHG